MGSGLSFHVTSFVGSTMGNGHLPGEIGNEPGLIIPFLCSGVTMTTKPSQTRGEYSEPAWSGRRQSAIVEQNRLNAP